MTTYIYEPLDDRKFQIRLVELHPAPNYDDPIRISLRTATLPRGSYTPLESDLEALDLNSDESDVEKPEFMALSYVWGSPDDPQEVFVESAPEGANIISITRNLDTALRHVRPDDESVPMWIDAICINQGSTEDRSHQVSLMGSIYTIAYGTLVWLGPEADNSDRAIELLSYMGERVIKDSDAGPSFDRHPDAPPREPDEPIWESLTEPLPYDEDDMRAIISFFERPWFTRMWIRQEVALARQRTMQCGHTMLDWTEFEQAASCLIRKPRNPTMSDELKARFERVRPTIRNITDTITTNYSYDSLRDRNRSVGFTDPRDAIYGIGGMLATWDKELGVQPDYSLEAADVFMDVCVRILDRQSRTNFLDTCELSSVSVPNLPSWVADWSTPMTAQYLLPTPWSACGFISANATYLGDRVLRVSGIQIDKIEITRDLYDDQYDEPLIHSRVTAEHIWRCYPGNDYASMPYDENQSLTDACCRTFLGNELSDTWHPPEDRRPTLEEAKEGLQNIWYMKEDGDGFDSLIHDFYVAKLLEQCRYCFGRCFFRSTKGYVGLAPLGSQPGDIISVILGCDFPVILREEPASSDGPDEARWKVMGVCYANGLMSGEAIYETLPSHYRAVRYWEERQGERIQNQRRALLDSRTNDLNTDPAAVLEECGIKPSTWTREPHRLEVPEDVLREAGVKLRDFFLV